MPYSQDMLLLRPCYIPGHVYTQAMLYPRPCLYSGPSFTLATLLLLPATLLLWPRFY